LRGRALKHPLPPSPLTTSAQQLAHSTLDNLLVIKEYSDFTYPQGWTVLICYYFSGLLVIGRKTIFFFFTHPQWRNFNAGF